MTDNEILNLILDKVTNLESDMKTVNNKLENVDGRLCNVENRLENVDGRLCSVENRLENMDSRLDRMDNELDSLTSQVSALRSGQVELQKELQEVSIKVSDTYKLALDAWGTSTENRKWLESVN